MTSSQVTGTFSCFPDLPPEIRIMIWRECLPHRIHELDSDEFYDKGPGGFALTAGYLPRMSRVSRRGFLKSRQTLVYRNTRTRFWESRTILDGMIDPSRDIVHLNWVPWDEEYHDSGNFMQYLAWHAANSAQGGSIEYHSTFSEQVPFLNSISNLVILMRKIIIHATSEYGARMGLFGLLGDAPVQIIDISDEKRLKAYFDLAEDTQEKGHVIFAQDLHWKPSQVLEEEFERIIRLNYGYMQYRHGVAPMRGAIMFRLCTDMCNNSKDSEEGFRPFPGTLEPRKFHPIECFGLSYISRGRGGLHEGRGESCGGPSKPSYRVRGRLRNNIVA
ncbi:hypothetical protein N7488_011297 [Penicillium malachiteum]|nr:hypothetical protein N7488_011297 [Penicillium malachiteum]